MIMMTTQFRCLLLALAAALSVHGFHPSSIRLSEARTITSKSTISLFAAVEAPTRDDTDQKTDTGRDDAFIGSDEDSVEYPDLEYMQNLAESREMEDPFHILLMGSTFEKPKVTVSYVCGSLEYVLGMPRTEANELAKFARDEGMSCLGTWPREECLTLGRQLQMRDIVCRVVPFAEGGHRGWQAKDASSNGAKSGVGN